jgi:hypothetical protein
MRKQIGNGNAVAYEIESWIMLFVTAIGGRFHDKEQNEAQRAK